VTKPLNHFELAQRGNQYHTLISTCSLCLGQVVHSGNSVAIDCSTTKSPWSPSYYCLSTHNIHKQALLSNSVSNKQHADAMLLYSGLWHTASMLLPSTGSFTNAP
jgi:hypothetical protein